MSNFYIRILVNNIKVRSTGKEKWQRDSVLKDFGCHTPFYDYIDDNSLVKIRETLIDHARLKKNTQNINFSPFQFSYDEIYHFKIQLIRKTKRKKDVVGEFYVPFDLRVRYIKDPDPLNPHNSFNHQVYEIENNPYHFYNMGDILMFKKYKLDGPICFPNSNFIKEPENSSFCVLELFEDQRRE